MTTSHRTAKEAGHRSLSIRARELYVVPTRRVPRATHVPADRTLHLVDVENLMGGPFEGDTALRRAVASYRAAALVKKHDHVVIGANPGIALAAKLEWPSSRLIVGKGPNGADLALMRAVADVGWVSARYDRLVIGSGDGIFEPVVAEYRSAGIAVGVISRRASLAWSLATSATFVKLLSEPPVEVTA